MAKLELKLANGHKLIAELCDSGGDNPPEIAVYIQNNKGVILQDIALVRAKETEPMVVDTENVGAEVLVWADEFTEDYTNRFIINEYNNKEELRMIDFERRPMIEAEDKYTFTQGMQISMKTGLIGWLRADMDADGNGFFSSWYDYQQELKTDEFKAEFDEVINSLREEGDILHNRTALAKYCYSTPQAKMTTEDNYYGVRIDTDKYIYLMRLNPNKGEYNLYCYCYIKPWLDSHLEKARKGIRFIDSAYNELFRIPDGGKIIIKNSRGYEAIRYCRYIDDYHVLVGPNFFHIAEFAERMESNGSTYEPYSE